MELGLKVMIASFRESSLRSCSSIDGNYRGCGLYCPGSLRLAKQLSTLSGTFITETTSGQSNFSQQNSLYYRTNCVST